MSQYFIPDKAIDQHIAILGKTGAGKSYAAKGIIEHLLEQRRQVCVVDPTGAHWGLRLAADGKGRGFDVVLLGGAHADIPLAERSGEAVARLVTQQGASIVVDTSGFTVGEYTRWFTDFASTLYTTIRSPLHLVIDEAHYFAPQGKAPDPAAGKMIHACNRLMSGGRSLGVRGLLITQRPAKLHKDSLTCADTLIAMRVIAPQDRGAIKDWIDGAGDPVQGKTVLDSLAGLKRGEGWVWYPEGGHLERTTFPKIRTYDSSATPTHGAKAAPKLGEINLGEVRKAMAEAVKEAEANDPKLLRAKIAELSKQLNKSAPTPQIDHTAIDKAVAAAVAKRDREWSAAIKERDAIIQSLKGRMGKAANLLHLNGEASPSPAEPAPIRPMRREAVSPSPASRAAGLTITDEAGADRSAAIIPKGEAAILAALIQYPDGLDRSQLTVLTGYKRSSRDAYLARLSQKGLVDTSGGRIVATEEAAIALPDAEPLPIGEELRDYWFARLPAGESAILAELCKAFPGKVQREALTVLTGYKRSSRDAYISRLKAKQLVELHSRGQVSASETLFV